MHPLFLHYPLSLAGWVLSECNSGKCWKYFLTMLLGVGSLVTYEGELISTTITLLSSSTSLYSHIDSDDTHCTFIQKETCLKTVHCKHTTRIQQVNEGWSHQTRKKHWHCSIEISKAGENNLHFSPDKIIILLLFRQEQ